VQQFIVANAKTSFCTPIWDTNVQDKPGRYVKKIKHVVAELDQPATKLKM